MINLGSIFEYQKIEFHIHEPKADNKEEYNEILKYLIS